jgi:hypothetical protein
MGVAMMAQGHADCWLIAVAARTAEAPMSHSLPVESHASTDDCAF